MELLVKVAVLFVFKRFLIIFNKIIFNYHIQDINFRNHKAYCNSYSLSSKFCSRIPNSDWFKLIFLVTHLTNVVKLALKMYLGKRKNEEILKAY